MMTRQQNSLHSLGPVMTFCNREDPMSEEEQNAFKTMTGKEEIGQILPKAFQIPGIPSLHQDPTQLCYQDAHEHRENL